jgi:hypothetical protein
MNMPPPHTHAHAHAHTYTHSSMLKYMANITINPLSSYDPRFTLLQQTLITEPKTNPIRPAGKPGVKT